MGLWRGCGACGVVRGALGAREVPCACTTAGPPGCELSGGGGEVSRAVGWCGVVSEVAQGTCRGCLAWMWGVRRGGSGFGSARSAVHAPPPAT